MTGFLVAALAMQAVGTADLPAEAERYGRLSAAVGFCSLMGYSIDTDALTALDGGVRSRATAAGLTSDQVDEAIMTGVSKEVDEARLQVDEASLPPAERRTQTIRTINGIKARCHAFASGEFSGVIGNMDAGDDSADALLAEMLAQIEGG